MTNHNIKLVQAWQVLRLLQKGLPLNEILATIRIPDLDDIMDVLREHVIDDLEECGSCGCHHRPDFAGDCRTDHERI